MPSRATAFVDLAHPTALGLLRPLVSHASSEVREAIIHGLLPIASSAVTELVALSGDPTARIREWATFGLAAQLPARSDEGDVDDPERRAALWARHDDADEHTRGEALAGLAAMRDPRAVPLIERALASAAEDASTYAVEAAELLADPRLPALVGARRSTTPTA